MSTKQPTLIKREQLADYIGKPRESNEWMTITQEMVNAFADATYDHQFIHVDPEKARKTPFGTTIAHGFFTLSLVPKLLEAVPLTPEGVVMGVNYGLNKVRFPSPVKTGSEIRVVATLKEVSTPAPDRVVLTTEVVVQVKGASKPALVAETLAMLVFGFGLTMEVSVIAFATFWPMLVLAQAAARQIEPRLLEVAAALQLSPMARLTQIVIPAMLPRLFVALRLGVAIALVVAVTVEIAANPHGMGYAIMIAQQSLDPALMLAWLFWTGIVGYAINAAALALQHAAARRMGALA